MKENNRYTQDERLRAIQLKLKLRAFSRLSASGRASQRGYGTEFHQLRDYEVGDDVRAIDWKSSARIGKLFIKEHLQEQQYTLLLLIDQSGSMATSSSFGTKYYLAQELAAIITCIAQQTASRLGAIFFTNQVNRIIPPLTGIEHTAAIARAIFESTAQIGHRTSLAQAFKAAQPFLRSDTILCIISDCIDDTSEWHKAYSSIVRSPCLFLRVVDPLEEEFINHGIVHITDAETGKTIPVFADKLCLKTRQFVSENVLIRLARGALCTIKVGTDAFESTVPFLVQTFSHGTLV